MEGNPDPSRQAARWTPTENSNRLTASMKRPGPQQVTVEGVPPGMPAVGEAPAGEGRLRSRSSCPAERPEGRGRAEGKDALGPDQGTIIYLIVIYSTPLTSPCSAVPAPGERPSASVRKPLSPRRWTSPAGTGRLSHPFGKSFPSSGPWGGRLIFSKTSGRVGKAPGHAMLTRSRLQQESA